MHILFAASLFFSTALSLPRQPGKDTTWIPGPTAGTDLLAKEGLLQLTTYLQTKSSTQGSNNSCTLENAHRRKEWDILIPDEKREYIKAVRCLQTLPSVSGDLVPGARTRYDDFVGEHLNATTDPNTIHNTGVFLSWHRYYLWAFEEALRNECGYTGYQPYANFGRYTNTGNGDPSPHGAVVLKSPYPDGITLEIPPASGGGCVTTGPFANYTINLGPVGLATINDSSPNPRPDGKGYNPRCFRRALNVVSASGCSDANSTKLITSSSSLETFQDYLQGPFAYGVPEYGIHASAHYIVDGDPGGDFFTSPGDPFFWFLHSQIDRLWWIWQIQDFEGRVGQVMGTLTSWNVPPSREVTLDDVVELGVIDWYKGYKIRDIVDTMGGPFCYVYE